MQKFSGIASFMLTGKVTAYLRMNLDVNQHVAAMEYSMIVPA